MDSSQFMIRRRTPLALMLYGVYVYLCSNSLRRASKILEPLMERSHEAVRQWVQRLAPICDRFDVDRKLVSVIFVDETMIRIRGREAWVWVAYEPGLRVFLAFHVSYNRSILDVHTFLKRLRSAYGMKPIWTDEGTFYPEACRWLRLEHHVYPTEWKNIIERMNQVLKDRLENFDDTFPCMKEDCDRGHVHNWISVFRFYNNYVRTNEEIGRPPMTFDRKPEYLRFIELISKEVLT
ncbi:MAG: DDE-type integrase/transposase/recombinase [Nitrososphaerales archaeon]